MFTKKFVLGLQVMPGKSNGFPRSKLYLRTMDLLRNRPITLRVERISKDTHLPKAWIHSIMHDPEISPSVDRIERLYEYLSKQTLNVP